MQVKNEEIFCIVYEDSANNTTYFSEPKRLFQLEPKENGNFLKFRNNNNNDTFKLSLFIKKKRK